MRDDFSKATKEILAKRVGYLCSNPNCRRPTIGSNLIHGKTSSIGIAAHITAASSGGKRYAESFSNEQRSHINNAIWLCANCATLIDRDDEKYTIQLLSDWKRNSEKESSDRLNGEFKNQKTDIPFIEADLIWSWGGRLNKGYTNLKPEFIENGEQIFVIPNKPDIHWELFWRFTFSVFNNSTSPALNIKIESIGEKHFSHLDKLKKINNLKPLANIDLAAKFSQYFRGNSEEADEILKHQIPEEFEGLVLKITYLNEVRKEHFTIVEFLNGEVTNTKA